MANIPREKRMKAAAMQRRRWRIRKKVRGTHDRPRLNGKITLNHIHVQIIDDVNGRTLCGISTLSEEFRKKFKTLNKEAAFSLGEAAAHLAAEKGITKVVFDRHGRLYHGRIKALAEGARKGGLVF